MIIPYPTFNPRHYQSEIIKAFFLQGMKRFYYLCHRRAGKDMTCWNILWGAACQRVGTYLYLLPLHTQARKIIWRGMIGSGQSFLSMVPKELIASINNTEMSIRLINGSIIQLGGSNNYNSLMGTNPVGIVLSEFALHTPLAIQYLTPILVENDGFLICQTTPRGKNHAYTLYNAALNDPTWFVRKYTIDDTRKNDGSSVITHAQIDAERRAGISEEILRQEWWLDFNVGVQGAYYTREIDAAEYEKRICHFEVDPNLPVFTSWDLGVRDSTVVILFQPVGHMLHIIHHIEKSNEGIEYFIRRLGEIKQQLGFKKYQNHFAPHDIRNREWGSSAKSRLSIAHDLGLHFLVVPNVSIADGIQAVRSIFPKLVIHAGYCKQFLDAIKEYRREYNEVNRVFSSTPLHNWASNCFTGDTEVLTRHGTCRIMNLPVVGEILTKCGWKAYRNPRITKRNAQLVQVAFSDGTTVRCTPEHLFLTESGWKSAESLTKGLLIQSSLTQLPSTSMGQFTAFTHSKNITLKGVVCCIGMFGVGLLEKSLRVTTSIIKTTINATTPYQILNAYLQRSIYLSHGTSINVVKMSTFHHLLKRMPPYGMGQKRADCGINVMRNEPEAGKNGRGKINHANSAKNPFRHWLERMVTRKNSAPTTAKPLSIESVKKINHREDVWCLTVPGFEHFSLSNGAIVHNCADALRYLAVGWRQNFTEPHNNQPRAYQMDGPQVGLEGSQSQNANQGYMPNF